MEYIHINKLITTSIYKQIASSITEAIDSGLLKYNDKLPTEKEICELYGISNTAVKMAYETLINEGKIKRIKGKGTYVTNRKVNHTDLHAFFTAYNADRFDSNGYSKEIILFDKTSKDYGIFRAMKLDIGELCYRITFVVKSKENPVLLQKVYLPAKFFPKFKKKYQQFNKLYDFIEKIYNHNIKHLHSTFSAISASSSEALLLNINPSDAISYVRTQIVDEKNQIIGYICSYFPGDFTEFEVIVNAI
ncbi:GntR family transcriptional regulator [Candidatus Izemoplasma sp. B36]|uniref:GntR family transcriptional regulator n=1 Tax=Candidatus Izemoplasma sp. B36 TaxID=3242468 RepID=UPI003557D9F7